MIGIWKNQDWKDDEHGRAVCRRSYCAVVPPKFYIADSDVVPPTFYIADSDGKQRTVRKKSVDTINTPSCGELMVHCLRPH